MKNHQEENSAKIKVQNLPFNLNVIEGCIGEFACDSFSKSSTSEKDECNESTLIPIVYRPDYDISIYGFECLHPFDTKKWGKVAEYLMAKDGINNGKIKFFKPKDPITDEKLSEIHSKEFMKNLKSKHTIVMTSEVCLLYFFPLFLINRLLMNPLRYQTSGTLLGTFLALKYSAAINLGGGFHHCSTHESGGFCFFADITMSIRNLWAISSDISVLIVDCDAHQGNGYARDVLSMNQDEKNRVYILDLFNPRIYPRDEPAKQAISREVRLKSRIEDKDYLDLLNYHIEAVINNDKYLPNFLIYNAGTDILRGDCLGGLSISPMGVIQRDETVFKFARKHNIPILMLLSGGYQKSNARVIADSILNLTRQDLITPLVVSSFSNNNK